MFNNNEDLDLETLWGDTPAEKSKFHNAPDGKYEATVSTVRIEKSKNGKSMIAWELVITNNGQEGRRVFSNQLIDTAKQIAFTKGQLQKIGLDVSSLQSLKAGLSELLDATVDIQLKTRPATGDYAEIQNVYINKVVKYKQGSILADDDLPF